MAHSVMAAARSRLFPGENAVVEDVTMQSQRFTGGCRLRCVCVRIQSVFQIHNAKVESELLSVAVTVTN